ncbi:MAG: hypothetical protein IJ463_05145 [Bacilli bacterium]|nr:hypothetical protein [Bacilli bacterium]
MENKSKKYLMFGLMGVVILALIIAMVTIYFRVNEKPVKPKGPGGLKENSFNTLLIEGYHKSLEEEKNYMISPYSLEFVLSMIRDGASGTTYEELSNLVPERDIKTFTAKERINIANALFIKNNVVVKDDFKKLMSDKYKSQILYDEFVTPDVINDWANKETYGMIPKVMEQINPEFLFGLGNATAIDVEWQSKFKCNSTELEKFNKYDGSKIDVAMMHQYFESVASYYKDDNATYVSLPYRAYNELGEYDREGTQLEFIGILPEEDVDKYINSFDYDVLKNNLKEMKEANDLFHINLKLPKFKYEYDVEGLTPLLINLGLKETLSPSPNFEKIADYDMSISNVAQKTFIELSESGTKAAAVTLVIFDANAIAPTEPEVVDVTFDKPFIYIIKDKNSDELLFFGVVYSPTEYKDGDKLCEEDQEEVW